jgi:hypothetical protein
MAEDDLAVALRFLGQGGRRAKNKNRASGLGAPDEAADFSPSPTSREAHAEGLDALRSKSCLATARSPYPTSGTLVARV